MGASHCKGLSMKVGVLPMKLEILWEIAELTSQIFGFMQQVGDWCCRNEGSIYVNRGLTQNGRKTKGKLVCNYANDWIGVGNIWLKRRHFFSTGSCVRKGIWIVELLSPAISNFHLKLWLVVTGTMEFLNDFPISWECHHLNWRSPLFVRGAGSTTKTARRCPWRRHCLPHGLP